MDINVRLGGSGSKNARQQKLSAKSTHSSNKTVMQLKRLSKGVSAMTGFASGNAGALIGVASGSIPIVGSIMLALGSLDRVFSFGVNIYEAHSGESMLSSNMKAYGKTGSSLGLNLVSGFISNRLTEMPRIHRANLALNYNQEIYNMNAYGEKNKVR